MVIPSLPGSYGSCGAMHSCSHIPNMRLNVAEVKFHSNPNTNLSTQFIVESIMSVQSNVEH